MQCAGQGSELWRVRVDLFDREAAEDRRALTLSLLSSLEALLVEGVGPPAPRDVAIDQGLGVTNQPVTGLLFWVVADDVGRAAVVAVETARRAAMRHRVGPGLYDVTIIPRDAVVAPGDPMYPRLPD